jgi:hypothetical protein
LRGQTVRVLIVNANALKEKRDAIMRFVAGYREAADWMYADPKALAMYAEKIRQPIDILQESLKEFHPKAAMQTERMAELDATIADAVKLKFLDAPLTKEQIAEFCRYRGSRCCHSGAGRRPEPGIHRHRPGDPRRRSRGLFIPALASLDRNDG